MIKHGVKADKCKDYEEELREYLEVEAMPESLEKHLRLVILNPDNYRSWKIIISELAANPKEIESGLFLTLKALQTNPKSYCAWNSRAIYLAHAKDILQMETNLCRLLLSIDPRNFHCWNHCRRFGLKIPLDYTNYSSLHNSLVNSNFSFMRPVENLFASVDDEEGAWAYFLKYDANIADLRVVVAEGYMNIHFKQSFTGVITYGKEDHSVNVPMLVYRINKMIKGIESIIELNGVKYKIEKKEEPPEINEILKLRPESVFALREKLKYVKKKTKRTEIIDKLILIDAIRENYYRTLETKSYEIFYAFKT